MNCVVHLCTRCHSSCCDMQLRAITRRQARHTTQGQRSNLLFISLNRRMTSAAAICPRDSSDRGPLPTTARTVTPGGAIAAQSALPSPRSRFDLRPATSGMLDADHRTFAPGCCSRSAALLAASALRRWSEMSGSTTLPPLCAAAEPSRACTVRSAMLPPKHNSMTSQIPFHAPVDSAVVKALTYGHSCG